MQNRFVHNLQHPFCFSDFCYLSDPLCIVLTSCVLPRFEHWNRPVLGFGSVLLLYQTASSLTNSAVTLTTLWVIPAVSGNRESNHPLCLLTPSLFIFDEPVCWNFNFAFPTKSPRNKSLCFKNILVTFGSLVLKP